MNRSKTSVGGRPARILGATWGDPQDSSTYSGVPVQLFDQLAKDGRMAGSIDLCAGRPWDVLSGSIDWRDSLAVRRPRRNKLWRYQPRVIAELSRRLRRMVDSKSFDAVLQFGVAGLASEVKPTVAHIEIPIRTAIESDVFSSTYGLSRLPNRYKQGAVLGEKAFVEQVELVWTNTSWTAERLVETGVDSGKIRVCPPGCGVPDPGEVARDWDRLDILFVGRQWESKGGALLVDAFRRIRERRPDARLEIVGCSPPVAGDGVEVLGYLSRAEAVANRRFDSAFRQATLYCMPSPWESTGVVYMEAAMYGLPVVMLAGQGREEIFPADMALHLESPDGDDLAAAVLDLASQPRLMQQMGEAGRRHVLENLTWEAAAGRVAGFVTEALSK